MSADYATVTETIAQTYDADALRILRQVSEHLIAVGVACAEPVQMWDDNYRWGLATLNEAGEVGEGSADFVLALIERRDHEGENAPAGVAWGLDISGWGGTILGGLTPYNFTEDLWIDSADTEAVRARFVLLRDTAEAQTGDDWLDIITRD